MTGNGTRHKKERRLQKLCNRNTGIKPIHSCERMAQGNTNQNRKTDVVREKANLIQQSLL